MKDRIQEAQERLRHYGYGHLADAVGEQADNVESAIEYVADPGNWSAYDARRRLLLDILNGEDPR